MPLPTDPAVRETSIVLADVLRDIAVESNGHQPGVRPAHGKGVLVDGFFIPTKEAKALSKAKHFQVDSTHVTVRFSNASSDPAIRDTNPNSNPQGFAIRFNNTMKPIRRHTDIIAHSVDGFVGSTGQEVLDFFNAIKNNTLAEHLANAPKAKAFVEMPKPTPASFATAKYYALNAFMFINHDEKETFIRYRLVPEAGEEYLTDEEVQAKDPHFLYDELYERLEQQPIKFKLVAQIAEPGDVTDDCLAKWPEDRKEVTLGTIQLEFASSFQQEQQKRIIFDPIPRIDGIETSEDPLLEIRAGVYLTSGLRRRAEGNMKYYNHFMAIPPPT
ncbi:hypothetical protein Hte_001361 [Hypoxylon texense]